MKTIASIVVLIFLLYLLAMVALYSLQRNFIYHPTPFIEHEFTELPIDVDTDVVLNLLVGNAGKGEAVIYFGGNAESVAGSAGAFVNALTDKTIYFVNYRGYGGSGGQPTEKSLFNDAAAIFDKVSENHTSISVIGRSLGSGVACWLGSQRRLDKMVLITPYDSILSIAKTAYPIFPVGILLKDQYRSVDYVAAFDRPVFAILAQQDRVIPAANSNRLIEAFPGNVNVAVLANTGHNDLQASEEFYPLITEFLD